jgi:hypothetical protein
MGIVPLGKIFAATVKDAPALVRSSWVARSVPPAQMSKLRAIRAIAGIAVANTIAAANPYLIKPFITIPPPGSRVKVRRVNAGKISKVPRYFAD